MIPRFVKWILSFGLIGLFGLGLSSCTLLGLNYASLETGNKPWPAPELSLPLDRQAIITALQDELYGPWPDEMAVRIVSRRVIEPDYLDGKGHLHEFMLSVGSGDATRQVPLILALPVSSSQQAVPLIISQTFFSNCSVFPDFPVSDGQTGQCAGASMSGFAGFIATGLFGRYIAHAPVERYVQAGFAYASFSGPDIMPDSPSDAADILASDEALSDQSGTLIIWAKAYAEIARLFSGDPHIRADSIIVMGHSRYGKSALIAGAFSSDIAAVIAHQSGFAGSASSQSRTGETLQRMATRYPHWLRPGLAEALRHEGALSFDQHALLALLAPKPVFLGNGRRDVWSDPNSTFRVARAADKVYKAYGVAGLRQETMPDFIPGGELVYWLRDGGHSIVSEDIEAFIRFCAAHFSSVKETAPPGTDTDKRHR